MSLGRNLFALLPEDAADRGPVVRGPYALVADVRIDNRQELERTIGVSESRAAQLSDTALLFECLLAWGKDALNRIAGEFALAFWDGARGRLLLARDILGLRPLVFHRSDSFFAFASMPSGLHTLPNVPYAFDPEYVAESLAMLPQTGRGTFFKGVERVEPAHWLEIGRSGLSGNRYWNPSGPSGKPLQPREYEEGMRHVLDEATRAQLRGAGTPIAAQLSGGLDSSIVVTSAARQMPEAKIVAFTAVPRRDFDGAVPAGVVASEADRAAATASLYPNIEHVVVENGEQSPLAAFDSSFAYYQQPLPNPCNNVWGNSINRLAKERGARVLLMGNAGNLTVSYYGLQWLPELLRQGRLVKLAQLTMGAQRNGFSWLSLGAQVIGPYLPMRLWKLVSRRATDLRQYAPVSRSRIEELHRKAAERGMDFSYRPRRDPLGLRIWALTRFDNGSYFKGMLAQWGLSARDPTGDKRLIEYSLAVPPEEYVRGGVPRSLARRAFGDRMPPEVAQATIRGYQAADWYEGIGSNLAAVREELEQVARCADAASAMDVDWLEGAVSSWPEGGWGEDEMIMRYRHGLLYGLSVGHFMRRVSGTN